ncbi:amidohydrolase, imidazolonepropionase [Aciduliprofundum sp. MAR08-339]|uniref:amidohydrolase family protein n=1 Tax=Aciduliprofundum sp. (strain MAR08-339) TaxID=673860 RepID=UPI0002A49966|nr:amidohydrolase, imidazolonepropionase [Aciduliprofundum sp. MAR08-339]
MKAIKAKVLYDGTGAKARKDVYVLFEEDEIKGISRERGGAEVIGEGIVTPGFIDPHCHIGMARSGEPYQEDETNEQMNAIYPLVNAIHSIYMDDPAFRESVEFGVLYSHVMPGSGNIIGGYTALIRNFARDIGDAFVKNVGIKAALGYNPRSTTDWKGTRPTTRMGAIAMLREELMKAKKTKSLLNKGKKEPEEVEPLTEIFISILDGKMPLMVHVHKEDDIITLMNLVNEFGIRAVINHGCDVHSPELWEKVKRMGMDVIYGPVDSFSYKVELKNESWHNIRFIVDSGLRFAVMSDHPVVLQRNLYLQLRFFRRFGMTREQVIALISGNAADIIGAKKIGKISKGYKASMVIWNGEPLSMESWPIMSIGEGRVIYES